MGKQNSHLTADDIDFIEAQHIFFMASGSGQEVNLSPRGYDTLRVIDKGTVVLLDLPGSGNRTARDIFNNGSVTIMFCSFDEQPRILRLFCKGRVLRRDDNLKDNDIFTAYAQMFSKQHVDILRQFFIMSILAIETSCGMGVPLYAFVGERSTLVEATTKLKEDGRLRAFLDKYESVKALASPLDK